MKVMLFERPDEQYNDINEKGIEKHSQWRKRLRKVAFDRPKYCLLFCCCLHLLFNSENIAHKVKVNIKFNQIQSKGINERLTTAMMSNQFITQINAKDEIKILKKKLQMLKDAVKKHRAQKDDLQARLTKYKDKCRDHQNELKKKDEKNQHLLAEIRLLKDALLIERNQKIKYIDMVAQMKSKQEASQQPPSGASKLGGYLGSFWKK